MVDEVNELKNRLEKLKNEIFEDTVIAQSDIRIHFVGDTGFANNCQ